MKKRTEFIFENWFFSYLPLVFSLFILTEGKGQPGSQMTLVTFGNSTTAPREKIEKVYALRVKEDLKARGLNIKVINAGTPSSHSGSVKDNDFAKVAHGRDRFDTGVLRYHPDWVTINFGLNDSWQDKGKNGPSRISVRDYRKNLAFYIDRIRAQNGKAILLTPNPVGKKFNGYHKRRLKKYRRAVRKLSAKKEVPLIDTWRLFYRYVEGSPGGIDSLLLDGIHPGDTGHGLIAKEIEKIIEG